MAAYAALVSVMQIINQIQHHPFPPISMDKQQFQSLTETVTSLQEFLEGYNSPVADSDEADPLEMRIADAAYAAEDVIESHIVDTIHKLRRSSCSEEINWREESSCIHFYQDLRRVTEEMDLIKKEAMEVVLVKAAVVRNEPVSMSSSIMQKSTMVGFDDVLLEVVYKLIAGRDDRQVIPIVGMGGIGKTTLAKNIFVHPLMKHFDISAWATISKEYNTKEILCGVLSQVSGESNEQVSGMSEEMVGLKLHQYLTGRRFLIVMDDMWSVEAWENTSRFFPENGNGSRVVVTTRLSSLGSELDSTYSLKMKFLDEAYSWELFSKTVFGEKGCCPLELEEIGRKIAENCRGLPLSILVVGGLLRKMEPTQGFWKSVWDDLISVVNLENDKHCLKLLKTSYDHLPVYLKPCFLYMGIFDEEDEISMSKLIRLWVSEGILKPINGKSLETTAEEFLKDLVERNLILIEKLGCSGNIKAFKLHDLVMDLCLKEGKKQRFYHVIRQRCYNQGTNPHLCRRILIPSTTSYEEAHDILQSATLARSIICDDDRKILACQNLGLLRIWNAYSKHAAADQNDATPLIFHFVNMRHMIVNPPTELSIFNHAYLWNLQTLVIYVYGKLNVPAGVWRMPQLRHFEFPATKLHLPDPPVDEVVVMENLHTLKGVENLKLGEEVLKRIPNIRRLLIQNDHTVEGADDDYYCVSNIECLHKLESLTYQEPWGSVHDLQKITFPHSIKKLTLTTSYGDDTMRKIGSLPLLQKLKLMTGSFRTGKWEIDEDQFPCLKFLTLFWCDGLKEWAAAEEASSVFPCLERLRLSRLTQLDEIPPAIGDIPTLRSIELSFCSESAVWSAKQIVEEQEELQGEEKVEFHVVVLVDKKHKEVKNLATPNFEVEVTELA